MLQQEALVLPQVNLLQHQGLLALLAGGASIDGVVASVAANGAATAGVGIELFTESDGLMRLSMMKAKCSNSSMLCSPASNPAALASL